MTGLERVLATCKGKEPDRVPLCPMVCGAARRVYGANFNEFSIDGEIAGKSVVEAVKLFGYDAVLWLYDLSVETHDFGQATKFSLNDAPRSDYTNPLVPDKDSYKNIKPIKATSSANPAGFSRMAEYIKAVDIMMNEIGDRTAIIAFALGSFDILGRIRNLEELFFDCVKHTEAVRNALIIIQEVLIEYIVKICKQIKPFGFCLGTPFACGGIMSKKLWKRIELPTANVLADRIRENGTPVWVHSNGNAVYFDVQIEAMNPHAISYAYPPDDCSGLKEMKEKYGDKIVLQGNIDKNTLLRLSREDLYKEIKFQCETLKPGGRYILAPGCEFPPNGNLNRVSDMMKAVRMYGEY